MAFQLINNTTPVTGFNERVLGIGLTFNNAGIFNTNYLTYIQAKENLKNLLLTTPGERVENVEFGCNLMYVIFEPNTETLKVDIEDIIVSAVSSWLPYIDITDLDIKSIIDDPNLEYVVEIKISFSINPADDRVETLNINLSENGVLNIS